MSKTRPWSQLNDPDGQRHDRNNGRNLTELPWYQGWERKFHILDPTHLEAIVDRYIELTPANSLDDFLSSEITVTD